MRLTTYGSIVALQNVDTGLTILAAPDDRITAEDWRDACRALNLPEHADDSLWDYAEAGSWCFWVVLTDTSALRKRLASREPAVAL